MTSLQSIYDFETPVEKALAIDFGSNLVACYTPANDGFVDATWQAANPTLAPYVLSAITFQKQRPRIELLSRTGGAASRNYPDSDATIQPVGGYCHDMGRALIVGIKVITEPNILIHREYLSLVRSLMATTLRRINGDVTIDNAIEGQQLTIHRVPILDEAGASSQYTTQDGNFQTDLQYSGQITIEESAITNLN